MFQAAPFTCSASGIGAGAQWVASQSFLVRSYQSGFCVSIPGSLALGTSDTIAFVEAAAGSPSFCRTGVAIWSPAPCQLVEVGDLSAVFWLVGLSLLAVAGRELVRKAGSV